MLLDKFLVLPSQKLKFNYQLMKVFKELLVKILLLKKRLVICGKKEIMKIKELLKWNNFSMV